MSSKPSARVDIASWVVTLGAAAIMMITTGSRQTSGLFLKPLAGANGLSIAEISLILAIGQFAWGASQPIFGALADRFGAIRIVLLGTLLLALGTALTPEVHGFWGLLASLGLMAAAGAGAGSFSLLISLAAKRLPAGRLPLSSGVINAGGSFGQFVFAPLVQLIISSAGWAAAMLSTAALTLLVLPLTWLLRSPPSAPKPVAAAAESAAGGMLEQLGSALKNPSYLLLHAGFFTCGFHVAFLVTHLPTEVGLCGLSANVAASSIALIGLFNIGGSLTVGFLGRHYRMKMLLAIMYTSRTVIIGLYLAAPKTPLTFYIFAAALGFTWLATVPPTAGLVAKLFGTRYMATLFGLTLLSHQTGAFFGAWLGGEALIRFGNYTWMWYADMALALLAALANLPIREARVHQPLAAAEA